MTRSPRIVVLSAPSGGGKTTIAKAVRERYPDRFGFSISATTRKPRAGEQDGVDYYFWTRPYFLDQVKAKKLLEHAEYAGELYGTLKSEVDRVRGEDRHVLLDIDVQGADQVARLEKDALRLFILPSEPEVWFERLVRRKSESPVEIRWRLERAVEELEAAAHFHRIVTNDVLDQAVSEVVRAVDEDGWERYQHMAASSLGLFARYRDFVSKKMQDLNREIHTRG